MFIGAGFNFLEIEVGRGRSQSIMQVAEVNERDGADVSLLILLFPRRVGAKPLHKIFR